MNLRPFANELLVRRDFVFSDLLRPDLFFVEELRHRNASGHREIHALIGTNEITMRLRDMVETIIFENLPDARRVLLAHPIDADAKLHGLPMRLRKLPEERVLRGACSATFFEDEPPIRAIRIASIRKVPDMASGFMECFYLTFEKWTSGLDPFVEGELRQRFERSISSAHAFARESEASRIGSSSPAKVMTLRLWSGSEWRSRMRMFGVEEADSTIRSTFSSSRPSEKFGTASRSMVIASPKPDPNVWRRL